MIEAGHPVPDAAGLEPPRTRARARGRARGRRSRAGADLGRRLGQLDRAGRRRDASPKSRPSRARCCVPAPTSARSTRCANISRASRAGGWRRRASGARRDARDLRRAGRRSGGDRLGPDRAGSHDACRRARDRRPLSARRAGGGHARARTIRRTRARSRAIPPSPTPHFDLVARPADAFRAAEAAVRAAGYECVLLGERLEGEAREVAAAHAAACARARRPKAGAP